MRRRHGTGQLGCRLVTVQQLFLSGVHHRGRRLRRTSWATTAGALARQPPTTEQCCVIRLIRRDRLSTRNKDHLHTGHNQHLHIAIQTLLVSFRPNLSISNISKNAAVKTVSKLSKLSLQDARVRLPVCLRIYNSIFQLFNHT